MPHVCVTCWPGSRTSTSSTSVVTKAFGGHVMCSMAQRRCGRRFPGARAGQSTRWAFTYPLAAVCQQGPMLPSPFSG